MREEGGLIIVYHHWVVLVVVGFPMSLLGWLCHRWAIFMIIVTSPASSLGWRPCHGVPRVAAGLSLLWSCPPYRCWVDLIDMEFPTLSLSWPHHRATAHVVARGVLWSWCSLCR